MNIYTGSMMVAFFILLLMFLLLGIFPYLSAWSAYGLSFGAVAVVMFSREYYDNHRRD